MMLLLVLAFYALRLDLYGSALPSLLNFIALAGASLLCAYCAFFISRYKARQSLATKFIETPRNPMEDWLLGIVAQQARQAGIRSPKVGIYDSVDINAFASGINRSMIAVSSGMLCFMPRDETEAVLGHEISHLARHDMSRLIAYQGALNLGLFYFSVLSAYGISGLFFNQTGEMALLMMMLGAELFFSVLVVLLLMRFSRQLEFRADAGGAALSKRAAMIAALERLNSERWWPPPEKMAVCGIKGSISSGLRHLLMSHSTLGERISLLKRGY
ncbi:zinc metalloprotease HtpX [Janthinobacterium sp. B9-8]|uniref:zinc metalloprotease HtpX n=1 Tax=Janthinobacterium sp. B9-8 TaxID=1236179 RepID=UPI0018D22936|nr:zinc metalloprotease HtpX [Janthinobacterium sp. B9-8]